MARKSRNDSTLDLLYEGLAEIFSVVPAWTSIPAAILGGAIVIWLVNRSLPPGLHMIGLGLGALAGLICLAAGFAGWCAQEGRKRFLDSRIDGQWVKQLTWRQFEEQVAAVYQRRGYDAALLGGHQPDGGVDVRLTKDGLVTLVQCKHWKAWKVGVKVVRELFGVMNAEGAHAAVLITSGRCTEEARRFIVGKPITIIEQDDFIQLVREFQRDLRQDSGLPSQPTRETSAPQRSQSTPPACPTCGATMVLRTARQSIHAGNSFWGCTRFPACRGIRNTEPVQPTATPA